MSNTKDQETREAGRKPENRGGNRVPGRPASVGRRTTSGRPAAGGRRTSSGKPAAGGWRTSSGKPAAGGQRTSTGKPGDSAKRFSTGKPGDSAKRFSTGKPGDSAKRFSTGEPGDSAKRFSSGKPGDAERKPIPARAGTERDRTAPEKRTGEERKPAARRPGGSLPPRKTGAPVQAPLRGPGTGKTAAKGPSEMEGLASRRAALKVVRGVTEEGAYASLLLDRVLSGSGLSGADRRLASRLVYDTLDNLIYLDHMLSQVMAREDTDIKLRNILRLGACQILLEDRIPESAATNTCVQLCAECGMEGLKGVCNGILRNLIRRKEELTLPDPETEPGRFFSVRYSLPEWLAARLRQDWGEETAREIASWRVTSGAVTIRRNLLRTDEESFRRILDRKIWGKTEGSLPGVWQITGAMDIARDADFLAGNFSIQSESSMMACLAAGVKRGSQVLDCCAAPGGKSCYLSELMGDTGRVQAWDIHEHRVALISAQQKRLGLENIRPRVLDATRYREELDRSMDTVLLDAPCSGLGVMAEKPDIKLRVSEEQVAGLLATQAGLLDTVSRYVKPGGVLVYSTCSLLKDENERQVSAFLERNPEFTAEPLPGTVPEKFRQHEGLGLQLFPHRDGVEGFYICRMRRKSEI